ncbi:hypothetical protein MMPV_005862 [Pyropia vietnamensis]
MGTSPCVDILTAFGALRDAITAGSPASVARPAASSMLVSRVAATLHELRDLERVPGRMARFRVDLAAQWGLYGAVRSATAYAHEAGVAGVLPAAAADVDVLGGMANRVAVAVEAHTPLPPVVAEVLAALRADAELAAPAVAAVMAAAGKKGGEWVGAVGGLGEGKEGGDILTVRVGGGAGGAPSQHLPPPPRPGSARPPADGRALKPATHGGGGGGERGASAVDGVTSPSRTALPSPQTLYYTTTRLHDAAASAAAAAAATVWAAGTPPAATTSATVGGTPVSLRYELPNRDGGSTRVRSLRGWSKLRHPNLVTLYGIATSSPGNGGGEGVTGTDGEPLTVLLVEDLAGSTPLEGLMGRVLAGGGGGSGGSHGARPAAATYAAAREESARQGALL